MNRWTVLSRRRMLQLASTTGVVWPFLCLPRAVAAARTIRFSDDPFKLGVASGDPSPDGFVLWTRLAPDPINGGGMPEEDVAVRWRVASDDRMKTVVASGTATASKDWGHSVHVEVQGLQPDRTYWYQFDAGEAASSVGRTRTTPAGNSMPDAFRFAFASCQHYETGYFTAYKHMAEDDLHAVVHLGDYIYEGRAGKNKLRTHNGPEIQTLDDYRNRHALYRTDADLQAAHAAFPWIVTWDDHEFDNNYAAEISEQPNVDTVQFLKRRAAAYQAYYEHMPLRRSALPHGPAMQLYRNVTYGRLAQFSVLDTRQYRSDQPCGDKRAAPCGEVFDPETSLLGDIQEKWLCDGLASSPARWNILAQQVMMARVDRTPGEAVSWSMDQWSGYDAARKRLLQFLADHEVANPVVITGDIHTNWVNDLKVDFDDENDPAVATEFVGTSITSGGNGSAKPKSTDGLLADNPFVKFYNAERGYVRCEVTPQQWRSDFRVVPKVTEKDSPCLTRASFVVENGTAGAQRA
ncbi:MAG: alkaline phosphatase D family protein [Planctomycetota bacterium]